MEQSVGMGMRGVTGRKVRTEQCSPIARGGGGGVFLDGAAGSQSQTVTAPALVWLWGPWPRRRPEGLKVTPCNSSVDRNGEGEVERAQESVRLAAVTGLNKTGSVLCLHTHRRQCRVSTGQDRTRNS